MIKLHPEILKKKGKKEFVVIPYEEFVRLQEALEDAEDLKDLRTAKTKEARAPTVPIERFEKMRREGGSR